MDTIVKFEPGKTYCGSFVTNSSQKFFYTVIRRTDKSVWLDIDGQAKRKAICVWQNTEHVYPYGQYSMAPSLSASNAVETEVIEDPDDETVEPTPTVSDEVKELRRAAVEGKQEARLERYQTLAEKNAQASIDAYNRSKEMASVIPFGQPILVGHHSERRDRKYRDKIWNTMGKSVELQKKAEYYEEKALAMTNNHSISSDDPDAVEKLQAKLDGLIKNQEQMKKANAAIRKLAKQEMSVEDRAAKVAELSGLSVKIAAEILKPNRFQQIGFPSFELTNNNAVIRSTQKRLRRLKAQWAAIETVEEVVIEHDEIDIKEVHNHVINRVQLIFPGKPDEQTRSLLKRYGFRWSPREGAWQRQLNANGLSAAKSVLGQLTPVG